MMYCCSSGLISVSNTLKKVCRIFHYDIFKISLLLILSGFCGTIDAQIAFNTNSQYRYLKGSQAATLSADWMKSTFDDSGWSTGNAPFRYGDGTGGTLLSDMQNNYSTVYLRTKFNAFSIDRIKTISFSVNYDDGFIIWINGVQVISRNAPSTVTSTSLATGNYESGTPVTINIDSADVQLFEGENLLCVQGFNVALTSSDFYFDLGISASLILQEVPDSLGITFDHEAGFYDSPFDLSIGTEVAGYGIAYTLDGSNPQTSATAININPPFTVQVNPESTTGRAKTPAFVVRASLTKNGFAPSRPVTRTYIFLDKVLTQAAPGGTWPSSSVNGQVIDLEMDPDVVNDARYSSQMKASLLDIPSISLVTDNANLFSSSTGIYVNAYNHGEQWERECSVELINPDKSPGFQVNAGVRVRGGASREPGNPKHAFRLFFRKEYGPAKLEFPLFGAEGASEFDKIDLRTEQNYSWSKDGDSHNTFLRDIFSRDLQHDMGQPYTRGEYYHLYLNGMYWGLFQTEERPEADYAQTYFGDSDEDYDVIKVSVEGWPYFNEATDGTMEPWQDLLNRCTKGFASNADYFALEGKDQYGKPVTGTRIYVNIDNLIDYMLTIFYTGNVDAPVSNWNSNSMANNYFAIFNRKDKTKGFVFIGHDSEHSMFIDPIYVSQGLYENRVTINDPVMTVSGISNFQPQWLHQKLTANAEYRMRFADRACRYFASGGALTPEKCLERWQKRRAEVEMAIIAESARWGDSKTTVPRNKVDDWLPEVNNIEKNYFPYRSQIVINQLKAAGLYSTLDAPVIKENGVVISGDITLSGNKTISFFNPNSTGKIYYTTDGNDPRSTGGTVSSSAFSIENNGIMTISKTTLIRARIIDGQNWSALREISFTDIYEDYSKLKVTEVHYHPADYIKGSDTIDSKDLEFIELKNTGANAINISGVTIDSAVFFIIPQGVILPAGRFYVVASKPEKFYEYYGMVPSGNFSGNLSNSGEYVLLNDRTSNRIFAFTYSDNYPWPVSADGEGYSLSANKSLPTGDPNDYRYWIGSKKVGGSPFADDEMITSVNDLTGNSDRGLLKLYPNPASDLIHIYIDDETTDQISFMLTDLNGRIMMIRNIENGDVINLSEEGLKPGVYFVTVQDKSATWRTRIVYAPAD